MDIEMLALCSGKLVELKSIAVLVSHITSLTLVHYCDPSLEQDTCCHLLVFSNVPLCYREKS